MDEESNEGQELVSPGADETADTNELDDAEHPEVSSDKVREILAQKKHWREKALKEAENRKKLELELEKLKPKVEAKEVQTPNFITKDEYQEGILRTSKGYSDEDITVLNVVAKGKGITLFQAEQDNLFKQHIERKAEEERRAKAQLGASRGSPASGAKKAPETREEHEALWRERMGR